MGESFVMISVGALKLENKTIQSRGLPAAVCLSLKRTVNAEQVLRQGCQILFPGDNSKFYLGNCKISGIIQGVPWTLEKYLFKHGIAIAASKCKFYIVKVCLQVNYVYYCLLSNNCHTLNSRLLILKAIRAREGQQDMVKVVYTLVT